MNKLFNPTSQGTYTLHCGRARTVLARLVPDPAHPNLWRVQLPGAILSDSINLARARDAARTIAARCQPDLDSRLFQWKQNQHETTAEAPPVRSNCGAVSEPQIPKFQSFAADRPRKKEPGSRVSGTGPINSIAI